MTIMTKRNMPRKPGGKPGKPSKPGKPGKPFERPEGENWVRTQIIWNWKKKQVTFISDFSPPGEEQSPNGDPMQGSSEVQLHLPFRHRWVLWPGSSLALINTVIYIHDISHCCHHFSWQVINMKATQCNHRKDVSKCPITLNTKVTEVHIMTISSVRRSYYHHQKPRVIMAITITQFHTNNFSHSWAASWRQRSRTRAPRSLSAPK